MKKTLLSFLFLINVFYLNAQITFTGCPNGTEVVASTQQTLEDDFFNYLNQVRNSTFGLPTPLIRSPKLDNCSRYHANDMVKDDYWCHNTFDTGGSSGCAGTSNNNLNIQCDWNTRINAFLGAAFGTYYVEHALGIGQSTGKQVIDAMVAEGPGGPHYEIIKNGAWNIVGAGVVTNTVTSGGFIWDLSFANGPVGIEEVITKDYSILPPSPNPFSENCSFRIKLNKTQNISIELFNMLGQKMQTIYNNKAEANIQKDFTIQRGTLPSGIYILRINGDHNLNYVSKITIQ